MIYKNMSNAEYHARPEVSKSQLDLINRDIYALDWQKNAPVHDVKMKTLDFGTATHAILLEPELLETDFVVMPKFNLRTNAGKEEKEQFLNEHKGKTVLTYDEREKLDILYKSVMAHPEARKLIEADGMIETSMTWKDDATGIMCRCRPDKIVKGRLIDIKTTPDIKKFSYSVQDYRYHVQEAFYNDGAAANGFESQSMVFLVIQKNVECGRYPIQVCTLPYELVEYGRFCYNEDLQKLASKDDFEGFQELNLHPGLWSRIEDNQMGEIK